MKFGINNPAWLQAAGNRMDVDWGTQFRLTSLEDDNVITFPTGTRYGDNKESVEYSFNNSKWNALPNDGLVLKNEQTVAFRAIGDYKIFENKKLLDASGKFKLSGKLLDAINPTGTFSDASNLLTSIFMGLPVVDASELKLPEFGYFSTDSAKYAFKDCTYLELAPYIYGIWANGVYEGMFENCSKIQSVEIQMDRFQNNVLSKMFGGCSMLSSINMNLATSITSVSALSWPTGISDIGVLTINFTTTKENLGLPSGWEIEVVE